MEKQITYKIKNFIEDRAVTDCSDGREVEILFEEIPPNCIKGDVLVFVNGSYVKS